MASDALVAAVARWAGTAATTDTADLDARYGRLADDEAVALEVLSTQYADLLAAPTKIDSEQDRADWTANLKRLDARIVELTDRIRNRAADLNDAAAALVADSTRPSFVQYAAGRTTRPDGR